MHVRQLVDIAGFVAHSGQLLIVRAADLPPAPLEQYWAVAKCRAENWNRALKLHLVRATGVEPPPVAPLELLATLEEIFVSEILARVWTTVLVARERRFRTGVDEPLARSAFDSHMEARNRALRMLLNRRLISGRQAAALNVARKRAERWSDVLIGGLLQKDVTSEFAVEPNRAHDFAEDLAERRELPGGRHAWRMTLTALARAFQDLLHEPAANPDANARLAASILGCFPAELFDSTGLMQSLWLARLTATASDAQGLIEELLAADSPLPPVLKGRRIG
jgi:hypothetical protein